MSYTLKVIIKIIRNNKMIPQCNRMLKYNIKKYNIECDDVIFKLTLNVTYRSYFRIKFSV
jgi:hypothetical protein